LANTADTGECIVLWLQVLMSSMASFASIVVLLVLFWMVFSIVGLHVFGGLELDIPWPNMDSLINSLIINFHVSAVLRATKTARSAGTGGGGGVGVDAAAAPSNSTPA
jgi:hypothetical protein